MDLASHLHLPLQEVLSKTTSSEFNMWMIYLEEEINGFHREDYYLAQIAAEIRKGQVKNPKKVKVKDMILQFSIGRKQKKTPMDKEESINRSKAFWFGGLGFLGKKKGGKK